MFFLNLLDIAVTQRCSAWYSVVRLCAVTNFVGNKICKIREINAPIYKIHIK